MIYLPNPYFQCDISAGGGQVAHSQPFKPISAAEDYLAQITSMMVNINPDELISKFENAECRNNQRFGVIRLGLAGDPELTGRLFGFVREDGCEFAISPVENHFRWDSNNHKIPRRK